jgi:hypothetical protein
MACNRRCWSTGTIASPERRCAYLSLVYTTNPPAAPAGRLPRLERRVRRACPSTGAQVLMRLPHQPRNRSRTHHFRISRLRHCPTETPAARVCPPAALSSSASRADFLVTAACKARTATAQHAPGIAAQTKSHGVDRFMPISTPPITGPRIDPMRPMPNAQPTPEERTKVG